MNIDRTQKQSEELQSRQLSRQLSSYPFKNPSRHAYESWNGWVVGSFVHVWLFASIPESPFCTVQRWQNHPVLLVDICKEEKRDARFIVVHLYDRCTAAQHLRGLTRFARWRASISLWTWPRGYTYVLSNHYEMVYEWDLRIWSRSVSPSVARCWAIDTRTHRLASCDASPTTDVGRALSFQLNFWPFLRLPSEIRDIVYDYTLVDERQMTNKSRIYTRNLLAKREHLEKGQPWCSNPSIPILGPLPAFHTPTILRVCKRVRSEALHLLYRTKIFVITVTSIDDDLNDLSQSWLPRLSCCLRIRVDFIMVDVTAEALLRCFHRVAGLLLKQASSLRFLEVRIGYPQTKASAALRDHGFALLVSLEDVARSMYELVPVLTRVEGSKGAQYRQVQITWGVSEAQKRVGDYSCECVYLKASFLEHIWSRICTSLGEWLLDVSVTTFEEEDCRYLGCRFHHLM
jgi:hypothetical protein